MIAPVSSTADEQHQLVGMQEFNVTGMREGPSGDDQERTIDEAISQRQGTDLFLHLVPIVAEAGGLKLCPEGASAEPVQVQFLSSLPYCRHGLLQPHPAIYKTKNGHSVL
ncbi:hypothetical protein NDU88_010459 [Pleurodeles waltl]|uniref:Uncharacterized protein n=1 Tax=Pleurodeles waltl TaxID=8319 RepID=A0AAV7QXG0_PLEWA|nr:hypothetical protein NDU88_010459 [Pleurodeles waltl]